jgi:NifB/MoaA-like Fe-S oxidoreductase
MHQQDTTISYVEPGSLAEEAGIVPGDKLLSINSHSFSDILEYKFLVSDTEVELEVEKVDGSI